MILEHSSKEVPSGNGPSSVSTAQVTQIIYLIVSLEMIVSVHGM